MGNLDIAGKITGDVGMMVNKVVSLGIHAKQFHARLSSNSQYGQQIPLNRVTIPTLIEITKWPPFFRKYWALRATILA